uniref:Uncharacterized protein n=1 Tax=Romanomermis culicivorax TaxID=13658 RepID=A0A915L8S9_ROMCU
MPTTHRRSQEEYILDLDIPDRCAMSPPPTPEADKVVKSPPTIPANYKIKQKQTANWPIAPQTPSKTSHNLLFLLHSLTPKPYRFRTPPNTIADPH